MSRAVSIPEEIFQNAINAIELGVEDYELSAKDPRRLQSAVRNLFAGILLLFKSKLAELSQKDDESLLKQKVVPVIQDGEIKWVGDGKKTVDVQQIQYRFRSLNIEVNWKRLDALQNYRNNIEHYFDKNKCNITVVRQYIVSGFTVIHSFLTRHLSRNPQECFNQHIWKIFLREKDIVTQELANRDLEFAKLKWYDQNLCEILKSFHCVRCESNLINVVQKAYPSNTASVAEFECRACGKKYSYSDIVHNFCSPMQYGLVIVNGQIPYCDFSTCPECNEFCYDTLMDLCYSCGAKGFCSCGKCGDHISASEMDVFDESGFYGYYSDQWNDTQEDD